MSAASAQPSPRRVGACTGPGDPAPCLVEGAAPDRSHLPAAGGAAWVSGDRLVVAWVGEADEVRLNGTITVRTPLPKVASNLFQVVIQTPRAQQTRAHLWFAVKRGDSVDIAPNAIELIGPRAFAVLSDGGGKPDTVDFGADLPKARIWLPPGYRAGVRYPILYLADGGWTSPGSLLTEPIRKGELAPFIVVGVDYAIDGQDTSDERIDRYLGESNGPPAPAFLEHERFLVDTVVPAIEARYGAPPERRLRAVGGASNGGVWAASMALRNPGVFGTAFAMSPGMPPAQHGNGRPSSRFYFSAGELEPGFRWNARCIAGAIVARGGLATFAVYPAGHDPWAWGRVLFDDARDWLGPQGTPVPAALPDAGCLPAR